MSLRTFLAGTVAGVLLLSSLQAQASPVCGQPKPITVVYPVADLVIPLDNSAFAKLKTQEAKLVQLLEATVAPNTWKATGGWGVVEYYPMTMSLVINQTPDVQEQIQDLLTALRKLQDSEVTTEIRFVTVALEVLEKLGIRNPEGTTPGMKVLDDTQVQVLLEAVQADRRSNVMQTPKLSMFNGQRAVLNLMEKQAFVVGVDFEERDGKQKPVPKTKSVETGLEVSVLPTISADRQMVSMQLGVKVARADCLGMHAGWTTTEMKVSDTQNEPRYTTLQVEKTVKVPAGSTALLTGWTQQREVRSGVSTPVLSRIPYVNRLFSNTSYGREMEYTMVMVTPRIINRGEEETKTVACRERVQQCQQLPMPTAIDDLPQAVQTEVAATLPPIVEPVVEKPTPANDILYVNKHAFDLAYQVENVGPSKVKCVEVWTRTDGKWVKYPDDVKPTGPVPIQVQSDGKYGFTLVARSGAGLARGVPTAGSEPQVWVVVDRKPPHLEIYKPDVVGDAETGTMTVGWKATDDTRLRDKPVTVEWSATATGTWTVIAAGQPADGKAVVPLKGLPYEVYLRATAIDEAGNACQTTTPEPVKVDMMIPVIRKVKITGK